MAKDTAKQPDNEKNAPAPDNQSADTGTPEVAGKIAAPANEGQTTLAPPEAAKVVPFEDVAGRKAQEADKPAPQRGKAVYWSSVFATLCSKNNSISFLLPLVSNNHYKNVILHNYSNLHIYQ